MITDELLTKWRRLTAAASAGPWRALRDGNQYVNTSYMPTAKLVGASRIEGVARPWNPHAYLAFGFKPTEFETVRFTDADADFVAETRYAMPALLEEVRRLRRIEVAATNVVGGIYSGTTPDFSALRDALCVEKDRTF